MGDYLSFKKMITPVIIQVLFWIGVVVVVILGLVTLVQGPRGSGVLPGLLMIVFGPVLLRIYAELLMIFFRINATLNEVNESLAEIRSNTRQRV